MGKILDEIKEQPEHVRQMFMWTFVVITFSVIGFVYFRSTEKKFVALVNPDQIQETSNLAEKTKTPSPFATMFGSWGDLKANISELFMGTKSEIKVENTENQSIEEPVPAQKLPLTD